MGGIFSSDEPEDPRPSPDSFHRDILEYLTVASDYGHHVSGTTGAVPPHVTRLVRRLGAVVRDREPALPLRLDGGDARAVRDINGMIRGGRGRRVVERFMFWVWPPDVAAADTGDDGDDEAVYEAAARSSDFLRTVNDYRRAAVGYLRQVGGGGDPADTGSYPTRRRVAGLVRRLSSVLRNRAYGPLRLDPEHWEAVVDVNAAVAGVAPMSVLRFASVLAPIQGLPEPYPGAARWERARGTVPAAHTMAERHRIVAAYRAAASEYAAVAEQRGPYPTYIVSLVRFLDERLRDPDSRWGPLRLSALHWLAVRELNRSLDRVQPQMVDEFVALLATDQSGRVRALE